MGRAEVGTPKYLANKMKAKGLQKLRWYCQMCEKQCRDENGFKCHTMSEAHQRQLLLFADSPGKFLHSFSKEFSDGYMELLKRRFGTKRTNANKIYQEYIAHKEHVHMNATRWLTLSDYVKWLGRTGQVVADETEKGWFVTYIDRSPEAMERQAKAERKEKMEKDDTERMQEFIKKQIEKGRRKDAPKDKETQLKEMKKDVLEFLHIEMKISKKADMKTLGKSPLVSKRPKTEPDDDEKVFKKPRPVDQDNTITSSTMICTCSSSSSTSKSTSALDEIIKIEEQKKERANRKDNWLREGLIVKFISKSMGDKFYNKKAVVEEVFEKYRAKIKFLSTAEKIKCDQAHLETVIPAIDRTVMVVNGGYAGYEAKLLKLNEKKFCVTVKIAQGPFKGRVVENVKYEDICKLA